MTPSDFYGCDPEGRNPVQFERGERPSSGSIIQFLRRDGAGKPCRIALIGGLAPRKCGIATFTTDVFEQLGVHHPDIAVDVHVIDDPLAPLEYRGHRGVIRADRVEDYRVAARRINEDGVDAVWLQHEYGIFGGDCGDLVLQLVDRVAAPLIVTLHTVLEAPSPKQRAIVDHLVRRASRIMVMSQHSKGLLQRLYDVATDRITVIAHGAPDRPFGRVDAHKAQLGLAGKRVMMTFGLIGPGKGLETVIEALPTIVERHPDVVYRIVGATHPNLVAAEGERYRDELHALAENLGVAHHVAWENRFLDTDELLDHLEACDIYLTPYPNLQQSTSGTLSYAVALGKAVVSTPYVHARELLADDVGVLIDPRRADVIADAVNRLLDDPISLQAVQRRAWEKGRETIWPCFAAAARDLVESVIVTPTSNVPLLAVPGFAGVTAMSDATGMLQHAIGVVPDRRHGYCLDDNVRALMLMGAADAVPLAERQRWATVYAAFIQHAWNPDARAFRNFMNFDRTWCEDVGSQDSNGRALWALGHAIRHAPDEGLRHWARQWFDIALQPVSTMESPRTIAFAMLGCLEALHCDGAHSEAKNVLERGGEVLDALLSEARRPDWAWFEAVLGYDNPRMSQALIGAGTWLNRQDWIASGLSSLRFIARQQVSAQGHFRPVGSETFGRSHEVLPFDQQPLEAWAAVDAAATAWHVTADQTWLAHAEIAYRWFLGGNDRGVVLADIVSGRCRDGVTPQGVNLNCGAESILAFQLAHYAMCGLREGSGERDPLSTLPVKNVTGDHIGATISKGMHKLAST
ncbi:glycosyltransferase [Novosphingobium sp. ERN07]|uniref:glycosyltransferase family 4 protein n=1 Tax=Novosphingobium sp. ERN07 TaxID=2726187 RepID=UPI001456F253|nr:glycosyltransferase family 4 protein [Novosphingobium sp. ERN07]NLR73266.1 glycosyltransferase [Novosphingobium sp. ERN07]